MFSTDGAYISLVGGQWAEVRTLAIGEVKEEASVHEPTQVKTEQITYFSRMTDADTFGEVAQVEMQRRGVSEAKAVCAVTDGADWIQGFIDLHRPDAVRILDFAHAAEHVTLLIEAVRHAGVALPAQTLERCLHLLKHRGPGLLLRWCVRLPTSLTEDEAVQKQLHYLRKREAMMQYQVYQQHGWPIGSGMGESANKVVVQARLKGAGMHWQATHVNPMLALRTSVCNERWEEAWQDTLDEQQAQLKSKRHQLAVARVQARLTSFVVLLLRFHPPTPKPLPSAPILVHPAATLTGSSRPSAHHPWKRGLACRPKFSAKN